MSNPLSDDERAVIRRVIDRLYVLRADIAAGRSHAGGRCALDEALLTELVDVRVERELAEAQHEAARDEMVPQPAGCTCHWEAGDSECSVHPPDAAELSYAASIWAPYPITPIRVVVDDGDAPDETGEAGE